MPTAVPPFIFTHSLFYFKQTTQLVRHKERQRLAERVRFGSLLGNYRLTGTSLPPSLPPFLPPSPPRKEIG